MSAEPPSQTSSKSSSGSQTPLPMPPSIPLESVDEKFADCNHSFTAIIKTAFKNPIRDHATKTTRKRTRLSMQHFVEPTQGSNNVQSVTAYFCDQWADLLHLFWPLDDNGVIRGKAVELYKKQISITFYGVRVAPISEEDADPNQHQNVCFIVDRHTVQSDNVWVEFKTCCNRICGRNGLRFTRQRMVDHVAGTAKVSITGNSNDQFLSPSNSYMPLYEVQPNSQGRGTYDFGCIYGVVVFRAPPKPCMGANAYSMQIRMMDGTLPPADSDPLGFQVMIFGNRRERFPNCTVGDIIRFHRISINYRYPNGPYPGHFQGLMRLDKPRQSFVVFDGNRTLPTTQESIKHKSSEKCSFDPVSDGYFIKYLREYHRSWIALKNPNHELTQHDPKDVASATTANDVELVYLSEIGARHQRVSVVVMIVGRVDIEDNTSSQETSEDVDIDMADDDTFEFYWTVWDGSRCEDNRDLLCKSLCAENGKGTVPSGSDERLIEKQSGDAMEVDDGGSEHGKEDGVSSDKWEVDCVYGDDAIIGSKVRVLVTPHYEFAVCCYTDFAVGSWVRLTGILVDGDRQQLVYDDKSLIQSIEPLDVATNTFIEQRLEALYHQIHCAANVVTVISSIVPHHQFQSFTPIRCILNCKEVDCRYLIKGKCTKYWPSNVRQFSRKCNDGNEFWMFFVLFIKDASDGEISVIFTGTEAEQFFGIRNVGDLAQTDSEQAVEVEKCMKMVMDEKAIVDLCVRSYQPKGRNLVAFKAMDTVLVK